MLYVLLANMASGNFFAIGFPTGKIPSGAMTRYPADIIVVQNPATLEACQDAKADIIIYE